MFTHPNNANTGHKWKTREGKIASQVTAFKVKSGNSIVAVVDGVMIRYNKEGNVSPIQQFPVDLIDDLQ